jgi:hypothetical protein
MYVTALHLRLVHNLEREKLELGHHSCLYHRFTLPCFPQGQAKKAVGATTQTTGFEFRGFRTGMTTLEFIEAMHAIADRQGGGFKEIDDCVFLTPAKSVCTYGLLYEANFEANRLRLLRYNIPLFEQPIEGFLAALTRKYGKPIVSTDTYQNGFGAKFTGKAYVWSRGKQTLEVAEICELD